MRFASLGSGSKGNGTLVQGNQGCLLIDCGFTLKEVESRLERLSVHPSELSAIVVTHEHGDHFNGVGPLARRYKLPVYMTTGTHKARNSGVLPHLELISSHSGFYVEDMFVQPVPVPHDAREPVQYIIQHQRKKLGILTDLGSLTQHIVEHYRDCDALILESNHCEDMLENGPYPPSLKNRVAGNWGHLNNRQAADLLKQVDLDILQHLVIAHLSEQNNCVDRVHTLMPESVKQDGRLTYACQQNGFGWMHIR
ncbi:MAG: MBL fold metallo-hydrolase [Pseudomonadales bacterium]|nr:MBL fold metallo-hydrolase [Pseudomonadales bacterium]